MAVIHLVRFKLIAGADETAFRAANAQFQSEATTVLQGLERREACRSADGEWALVLRYRDLESAKTKGAPSEAGQRIMGFIDKSTMTSAFFEVAT